MKMRKECDVDMSHMNTYDTHMSLCHYVHLNSAESAKMKKDKNKERTPFAFLSTAGIHNLGEFRWRILSRKRPSQGCGCSSTLPEKVGCGF